MTMNIKEQFDKRPMTGSTQWYDIKVSLESDNLDDVEQVEYYLDRSVSNPVIVSANPENNFEIQAKSWKEFPVSAKVTFKDHSISPLVIQTELKHAS